MIYEVVWTRLFTVVIGNTVFSVSAILTIFMAGLALGARLAGGRLDRKPIRLVRAYALLEGSIGIYNLLLPLFLKAADPIFGFFYSRAYQSTLVLGLTRVILSFAFLIVPATLMGATLPILIRICVENVESIGTQTSRVYAANTIGAAIGAAAAGFVLVPYLGVTLSLYLAAALNLAIAAVALGIDRNTPLQMRRGGVDPTRDFFDQHHPSRGYASAFPSSSEEGSSKAVLVAMFLSGAAALINEVGWTRVLGLVVGPTTYAFTLMLCSMIAGLGLGAAIASHLTRQRKIGMNTLAWIEIGIAFASLALVPFFGQMPVWIATLVRRYSDSFSTLQLSEFLIFFGLMLAPTALLGMTFPIGARLYAKSDELLGTGVGAVYAFTTAGGILGSLAAGYVLLPGIGSRNSLLLAAFLSAAAGVTVARNSRWLPAFCALLVLPAIVLMPEWNPELMAAGAYKYAPYSAANSDLETVLAGGDLLYFKEGATTTVSVRKFRGDTSLSVDGKVDATDAGDMVTQKLLAHIPLLVSKAAKNVAIVGFGSGVTAGAALSYPIEHLDVVEISPEVIDASRFFLRVNHNPLADPRTELIVGDGRNHLRYTQRRYDVIISEPSNPWMSGMALLFTREFFHEARSKLTGSGIHCQWFHGYNMPLEDLQTIVRTFRAEFPHAVLFTVTESDFLLLGSPAPITIDEEILQRNFERGRKDLQEIKVRDLYSIVSLISLRDTELDRFADGAALNTDARPILEFRAPRYIYANTTEENLRAITSISRAPDWNVTASPENHRHKGEMLLTAEAFGQALEEFQSAINTNADDDQAWKGLIETERGADRAGIRRFIEEQLRNHPTNTVRFSAAEFYSRQNDYAKTIELLDAVLKADPNNTAGLEKLADTLANSGSGRLDEVVGRLLSIAPNDAPGLYHLATIRLYQGRADEAIQAVKHSLEIDPLSARARNLLAIAYGQTYQPQPAEAEFQRALKDAPEDWVTYNNYGLFLLERNRPGEAREQFQRAIRLNPYNVQGFVGIGEALRQAGDSKTAQNWYRKALRLDPNQPVARQYVR